MCVCVRVCVCACVCGWVGVCVCAHTKASAVALPLASYDDVDFAEDGADGDINAEEHGLAGSSWDREEIRISSMFPTAFVMADKLYMNVREGK